MFQCASGHPFNDESCTVSSVPAGALFVTVHAYTSFHGVSIMCDDGSNAIEVSETERLEIGVGRTISAELDEKLRFEFHAASIPGFVQCSISGGTGDADLYISESPVNFENPGQDDVSDYVAVR